MRSTRIMLAIAAAIAITAALLVGGLSDTTEAKKKNKAPLVTFEFSTTFDPVPDSTGKTSRTIATEMVQLSLCAANIGSSGLDGVSAPSCVDDEGKPVTSDWQIDSFFDVTYDIFGDPDFDTAFTVDIELVALSLTGADPVAVLDAVDDAISSDKKTVKKKHKHRGHVTILK